MIAHKEIEIRLNRVMGLDLHSIGPSTLAMAIQARKRKRKIQDEAEYCAVLEHSDSELQELIEELVVPETWFFRDRAPFEALTEWVRSVWGPEHPMEVLRVLSAPCSSGEEPFSIVMALLDAGLEPERFSVEAVDISRTVLERARQGIFGRNSFRGQDLEFRERYFTKTSNGWTLNEAVLKQVQFSQANVLDPSFASAAGAKDVIFCRNLLIYFDQEAQSRLLTVLSKKLAPDGLLFVGHAEAFICSSLGFETAQMPMAFAFRNRGAKAPETKAPSHSGPQKPKPTRAPLATFPKPVKPRVALAVFKPAPETVPNAEANLEEAQRLADAGRFEAAMEQCDSYLRTHGPSSRAFCLLGLIHDAAGETAEAQSLYRKALYLEPDHCEALAHLALLAKKSGDTAAARHLQQRGLRAQTNANARTA